MTSARSLGAQPLADVLRPSVSGRGPHVVAILVTAGVIVLCGALLALGSPLAPYLLIGIALSATAALVFLHYPKITYELTLLLAVLPLTPWLGSVYSYTFDALLVLSLAAWALHSLSRPAQIDMNPVWLLAMGFIAWATISIGWADDLVASRQKLVAYLLNTALLFLAFSHLRSPGDLDRLMRVLAAAGWILVLAGLQAVMVTELEAGQRLNVLHMNENVYGLVLILALPGVIWPTLRTRRMRRRIWIGLSFLYVLCAILLISLSGSRGSALSLLLVLLSYLAWRPLRPWGFLGLGLLAMTLLLAPTAMETIIQRIKEEDGGALGGRDLLWVASIHLIGDLPFNGAGLGNDRTQLNRYIAELTSMFNSRNDLPSHNPILEVGVQTGILGMLLFTIMLGAAWQQFFQAARCTFRQDSGLPSVTYPLFFGVALGSFVSLFKSGGMDSNAILFVLLLLLAAPAQIQRWAAQEHGQR